MDETDAQGSQWCVSSLLLRSGAKEEPRSFPAIESHRSLDKKALPGLPVSGLVLPCEAMIKWQEWIQERSPDGPTLCWRLIWDATLHCATHWPRLVVGQATECKSTLLARLLFGTSLAVYKVLSWDVICGYHLPVCLDTDANGSLLMLAFLFLLLLIIIWLDSGIFVCNHALEPHGDRTQAQEVSDSHPHYVIVTKVMPRVYY